MDNNKEPVKVNGVIIVLAVYINNNHNNFNHLVNCLNQLRVVYKNEVIVAVDNGSLNTSWYEYAKKLNINILYNNSVLHRFEIGAYKLALQHFRADTYIFIQGTIYIKKKLNLSVLDSTHEMAISFGYLNQFCWDNDGKNLLRLINKLLESIHMNHWNNDGIVLWNSFCCNNPFITGMLNSGIFDLPSNTKAHSCAFERILACYFMKTLKRVGHLDESSFRKIFLSQDPVLFTHHTNPIYRKFRCNCFLIHLRYSLPIHASPSFLY